MKVARGSERAATDVPDVTVGKPCRGYPGLGSAEDATMAGTMSSMTDAAVETRPAPSVPSVLARPLLMPVLGLAIVAVVPALFWTALFHFVGSAAGVTVSAGSLLLIGGAIALILGVVFTALLMAAPPHRD
jgi:hypothetical protein